MKQNFLTHLFLILVPLCAVSYQTIQSASTLTKEAKSLPLLLAHLDETEFAEETCKTLFGDDTEKVAVKRADLPMSEYLSTVIIEQWIKIYELIKNQLHSSNKHASRAQNSLARYACNNRNALAILALALQSDDLKDSQAHLYKAYRKARKEKATDTDDDGKEAEEESIYDSDDSSPDTNPGFYSKQARKLLACAANNTEKQSLFAQTLMYIGHTYPAYTLTKDPEKAAEYRKRLDGETEDVDAV